MIDINKNQWLFLIFVWLLVTPNQLYSMNEVTYRLCNNDGLSNSSVNTIFQDSENIMWFGTWDGLNRYDGTSFAQYRPIPGNEQSISNQIIRKIFEEDKHHLWIVTDYGINRFNKLSGKFTQHLLGYKDKYTFQENSFMCSSSNHGIIVASSYKSCIYVFNKKSESFYPLSIKGEHKTGNITELFFDEKNFLWIQNENGEILRFAIEQTAHTATASLMNRFKLPEGVKKIIYDKDKNIWFAKNNTLYYIDTYSKQLEVNNTNIQIEGILNCVFATENELHIGTTTSYVTIKDGKISRKLNGEASVLSIFKGSQNITWIGTDGKGIYQRYNKPNFLTLINSQRMPQLKNFAIRALVKDNTGNIWVGSKGGGLSKISYLGATGLEKIQNFNVGSGLTNNSILSISKSAGNNLWIGTDGYGLYYYSADENRIRQLQFKGTGNPEQIYSVYSILQTDPQTLYLGSSGGGLLKLGIDAQNNITNIEQFRYKEGERGTISSNIVYAIIEDGSYLWIGTRGGGLNRFDKRNNNFTTYKNKSTQVNSLSSNDVISLHKDLKGRIWVGTTSGLNLIEKMSGDKISFKRFNEGDGLPNTNIHAIQEDSQDNIWVSTSNGLARIEPEEFKINSYFYEDGLQDNEFSDGASFATSDRTELYFGGINGFNIIHPSMIGARKFMPTLLLNRILVDNSELPMPGNNSDEKIAVSYQTGSIALGFSVPDFVDNKSCQIAYQLVKKTILGKNKLQKEWINPGQNKHIILNKLNPGDYTLYVKYCNADQVWSNEPFKMSIAVTPPLWETWWAILLYILFMIGGSILFYYFKKYKMSMNHKLELEKREIIKKEEIHQAKLKFFTNIAHEFSNSITLIYGSIEQIFINNNIDPKSRKQLVSIKRNAERMHEQIQQLMEFRKAETGHLTIRPERVDVAEMIKYTLDNFIDAADSKKINIRLDLQENIPAWIIDRGMLEKIIFNLLSNAMKYTPINKQITIGLKVSEENKLILTCTNSGAGIKPENLSQIFNRFQVLDNFESKLSQGLYTRNGIGLAMCRDFATLLGGTITVDSRVDEYTTFTVALPQGDEMKVINIAETDKNISSVVEPFKETDDSQENKNVTILIVDDQEEIRKLITEVLSGEGYRMFSASNGKEALDAVHNHIPDLIICDIIMPEMDGITLLKILKETNDTRHIPVILLSSKSDIENQIIGLETGANIFISKPFHPKHLKAAVKRVLGNNSIIKAFADTPQAYKEKYNNQLINKGDKELIDRIIELLQENSGDESYNQDSLADDLLISRVQLYRKMKQITQKTPGDFIRNFRIKQAERMLITTDKTVQEIMNECGFRNKAYFYREFAKIHNCSPKDFRTQSNKEH